MNIDTPLGKAVGGLLFLILAVCLFLIAWQLTARTADDLPDRLVQWRRRNLWSGLVFSLVLAAIGIWSLSRAISQLARGRAAAAGDLIVGPVCLLLSILAAIWHKELARRRADADERWWQSLREHPHIFGIIFLITAFAASLFGVAMLYNSIQKLF